jgi:hypothetical protein
MVGVVQVVGTLVALAYIHFRDPFWMFLTGSIISAMCFVGFLGIRTFPSGKPPGQILGTTAPLIALAFSAAVLALNAGGGFGSMTPYVVLGIFLPAITLGYYLSITLRNRNALPPPPAPTAAEDIAGHGPALLFDPAGIVLASLLTTVAPISITLVFFIALTARVGAPLFCPVLLFIAIIFMGIAGLRKGARLHWAIAATIVVISYGAFILYMGLLSEEFFSYLGLLMLTYGIVAGITFLKDALWSHRMYTRG